MSRFLLISVQFILCSLFTLVGFSQGTHEFNFSSDLVSGCSPLKITFLNETDIAYRYDYSYEWIVEPGKFSTQTDVVDNTYINSGNYTVTMRVYDDNQNLVETVSKTDYITVFRDPQVTIQSDKQEACVYSPVQFSVDQVDSDAPIDSWKWVISDGTSYYGESIPAHSFFYASDFTIFVTVTDTNGCINRERSEIEVSVFDDFPMTNFIPDNSQICEPSLTVNFNNVTTPDDVSFEWDFGDGSTSTDTDPTHAYNGYGEYYAQLSATSPHGCVSTSSRPIRLIDYNPSIVINDGLKSIDGNKACIGTINFTADVTPSLPPTILYEWDFGNDGSYDNTGSSFSEDILTGGLYQIKLRTSNGVCMDSVVQVFEVEEELQISYEPTAVFFCEDPVTVNYVAQSNLSGTEFDWDFYNGTQSGQSVSVEYLAPGFFSDSLHAVSPNGCEASVSKEDNVEIASHTLKIFPTSQISGCAPYTVSFDTLFNYSAIGHDPISLVEWDLDNDGTVDVTNPDPPIHEFTARGEYPARVTITTQKGCVFTDITQDIMPLSPATRELVVVGDSVGADLIFPDTVLCASSSLITLFESDDAVEYRYNSIYDTLIVTFYPDQPLVYPPAIALKKPPGDFDPQIRDTVGPHKVYFHLSDHGCSDNFVDSTDDKTRPTEILVQGPILELKQSLKDCDDNYNYSYELTKTVNVDTIKPGNYYDWYIGNVVNSQVVGKKKIARNVKTLDINFDHDTLGRGRYMIQVIAYNAEDGCYDSVSVDTRVTDIEPAYTLQDTTVCLNDIAVFEQRPNSHDVSEAFWIHPDNPEEIEISIEQDSIFYHFNSLDIRRVTVVGYDIYGCRAETTIPVKVYQPQAAFFADIVSDCLPFESEFVDTTLSDTTIVSREWDFGNGQTVTGNDSIVQTEYAAKGLTSPSLRVTDILGCESYYRASNYIKPVVPNSQFVVANPKLCLNHNVLLVRDTDDPNYDNNIDSLLWDFGDGTTDDVSLDDTVRHKYIYESMGGTFLIDFTAYSTSPEGHVCVASSDGEVEVKDVASRISIRSMDECKEPGQKFVIDLNETWYKTRYETVDWWKEENGDSIYIGNRPNLSVLFFDEFGEQKLFLKTTTSYYGCEEDTTQMIIDVPGYTADFSVDKDQVCIGEEISFDLFNTQNIDAYNHYFEFGDGTRVSSGFDDLTHAYDALPDNVNNSYKVQFIVEAPGCKTQDISKEIALYPVMADFDRGEFDIDTIGCAPYEVSFVNKSVGLNQNNYTWDFGDGTTSMEENPTHSFMTVDSIYNVSLSMEASVCDHTKAKPIYTYPLPVVEYITDTAICVGETVSIEALGDFSAISWRPSQLFANPTNSKTTVTVPQSMYLNADLVSQYDCESTDSLFMYVQQHAAYIGAPDSLLLYYFSADSLRFTSEITSKLVAGEKYNLNNDEITGIIYSWTPANYLSCDDCASPDVDLECGKAGYPNCLDFPGELEYTVYMSDVLGCFTEERTIRFEIVTDSKARMPQAFTPNSDGSNDFAFVRGWGVKEFLEVRIYNRWGQMVFMSKNIDAGWDGRFKGEPQKADTYSYTIKYISSENKEEFVKGYITLLR
ncbi:MAG: PKD domain-containing protein [Bacteroidales bacterium]|jgi:gliding motility-associated-like protein|nr:PKD domain-containing protein [Bacteroidales bacterium]